MDFLKEIEKIGLSEDEYKDCLQDIQDKVFGLNDLEWGEIKEKYNLPMSIDSLRKSNSLPFGGAFVAEYLKKDNIDCPNTFVEQMDKIRKEKQKLSDERTALRKLSREDARAEENFNILANLIRENGQNTFEPIQIDLEDYGNDIIACISDLHIGLDADSMFGKYNSDIAKQRMIQYIVEIIKIQRMHNSQNIYLACLGDLISGNIHPTVRLENREDAVTQVQMAGELLAAFVYELSKHFNNVYIADVPGNHSRLGLKDECLRDERLDDLIIWYMKAKLEVLKNVHFIEEKYDATISAMNIRGNEYLLAHGDFDRFSEAGINKLIAFLGHKPAALFVGHLHHCSFDDINDVKMIRSGSFAGTCDDYTVSKRLYSKPSQMVCIADEDGIKAMYPVILK